MTLRQVRDLPFPLPVQGEAVSSWGSEGRAQQRTKGTGSPPPVNLVGPPLLATAVRRQLTGPGRLDIQSEDSSQASKSYGIGLTGSQTC